MDIFNLEKKTRTYKILLDKREGNETLCDVLAQMYEVVLLQGALDDEENVKQQLQGVSVVIADAAQAAKGQFALLNWMRRDSLMSAIPVLVYCAEESDRALAYACLEHGAVDMISMPLEAPLLGKRIENAVRLKNAVTFEEIERMLRELPSNIYLKDVYGKYIFATHYWHHLEHGNDPDWTIRGKTDVEIRKDKDNAIKAMESDMRILQTGEGTSYTIEINEDGLQEFYELIKEPIKDDDQNVVGIIGLINNVTEMELLRISLEEKAMRDELTGLDNRYCFDKFVAEFEDSPQFPVSMISADCNDLKVINDTYGHVVGDEYIRMAALLFKMIVPEESRIFRIGGDEFVIVLPSTDQQKTMHYVERLKEEASHFRIKDKTVSIAYGVFGLEDTACSMQQCLEQADQNMYQDKRNYKKMKSHTGE